MAGYSDSYDESLAVNINNLYSLVTQDNESLARKVVDVARTRQVEFVQSFWNLPESSLFQGIRSLHDRGKLKQNTTLIKINFDEYEAPEVPHTNSKTMFKVPIPSSHIPDRSVSARLISSYRTKDMIGSCSCIHLCACYCQNISPQDSIMFHVHGGGFISQTSLSHLDYLQDWAIKLGIPILSIDYSLAPEAPFPRGLEEIFYCYV